MEKPSWRIEYGAGEGYLDLDLLILLSEVAVETASLSFTSYVSITT